MNHYEIRLRPEVPNLCNERLEHICVDSKSLIASLDLSELSSNDEVSHLESKVKVSTEELAEHRKIEPKQISVVESSSSEDFSRVKSFMKIFSLG